MLIIYQLYFSFYEKSPKLIELAMIHKLWRIASTATAAETLIRDTDWWKASLRLKRAVLQQITRAGAPKVIWNALFLHQLALNPQPFCWFVHSSDWLRFITTTNTTSVLLQMMFIRVLHKYRWEENRDLFYNRKIS